MTASCHKRNTVVVEIARYILAFLFLFSGAVKAIDPIGSAIKIEEYFTSFGMLHMRSFGLTISILLISVEFLLGAMLLLGVVRRLTAWLTLVFMVIMTLVTLYLVIYNPISDCGCFGDAFKISNAETFAKNIVFLGLAILYLRFHKLATPIFANKYMQLVMFVWAAASLAVFLYCNLAHLPMIDFRPYKVGTRLSNLVLAPSDAKPDEYQYSFVYEKNGSKQEFALDSLPDSTWTFVERKETLLKEGYKPPVLDFALYRHGQDVTHDLLFDAPNYMIWILSPSFKSVDAETAEKLNDLYKAAKQRSILLYGVSGTDSNALTQWKEQNNVQYPMLLLDATICKTIARANPSLIFIKDGVIQAKLNANDLNDDNIPQQVEYIFNGAPKKEPILYRTFLFGLWLLISLAVAFFPPAKRKE